MRKLDPGPTGGPNPLTGRFDVDHDGKAEATPTTQGLQVQAPSATRHPVDRVYGVLDRGGSTCDYIEAIRGR